MVNEELIDYAIYKLTMLQIEQEFEDKEKGKVRYVKKSQAYKDLVNLLKNIKREVL